MYIYIYIYIILSQLTALQGILSSAWKARGIDSAAAHKDTAVPGAISELSRSYPLETSLIWAIDPHRSWPLIGSA